MNTSVAVHDRCIWIVDYLRRMEDTSERTIRHIWDAARQPQPKNADSAGGFGDPASLPTYHRTVAKLVRQGQVVEDGSAKDSASLYRAAPQLSPLSTYTLTDLNAALWELSAPEALALYLDAVDYYESRAEEVLKKAADRLMNEDPRQLILRMLKDLAAELEEDAGILHDPGAVDKAHRSQTELRLKTLRTFVYGELGINGAAWHIPTLERLEAGADFEQPEWSDVETALEAQIFGNRFIDKVKVATQNGATKLIVAGSDGSSHAGYARGIPAPQYVEEEGRLLLTFNNSIAYVDLPVGYPHQVPSPYHGVPMTRAALEDPHNRGMIISRPWFDDLTDSRFEHMKKAALDVVQFRVDERLITGAARAYGSAPAGKDTGILPKPNLLIRDGTVTPQEREFQHYYDHTSYGDVVREGIGLSYNILRAVMDSERRIFSGAVKMTSLRTFSRIINWYIKREIDQEWDLSKVCHVTDPVAVTRLLAALPPLTGDEYYRTCIIVRPFSALSSDLRGLRVQKEDEWLDYFTQRQIRQAKEFEQRGGEPSWFVGQELEDDPYVRMCQIADYASFYFGKPGGDPQLTLPRFEFMDALRRLDPGIRVRRVAKSVELIMSGVHLTKWSLDREHNFMAQRKMPRMIPYVVYEAHEKCKALGHKLESELRQAIAERLSYLKALRGLPVPKVQIEPVSVRDYLNRVSRRLLGAEKSDASEEIEQ